MDRLHTCITDTSYIKTADSLGIAKKTNSENIITG